MSSRTSVQFGLNGSFGVLLSLRSTQNTSEETIPCHRFICEDALLFIPSDRKEGGYIRAIGESALMAAAAAGGLLTVAALAPIIAATAAVNRESLKNMKTLRSTADVLAYFKKTFLDSVIFPYDGICDLEIERQSFSILGVSKNPFGVSVSGSASVFGTYTPDVTALWMEPRENKGEQLHAVLSSLTSKARYRAGSGWTFDWKNQWDHLEKK